jgi:hypothetical protein
MAITLNLTEEAERFLRGKIHKTKGHGAFVSALLIAEQAREEMRHALEHQRTIGTRREWEPTGCNVD